MGQEWILIAATAAVLGVSLVVALWPAIERGLARWLAYWHGPGADNQYQFYRCHGCRGLVTHAMIAKGGCHCRMGRNRVSPTSLSVTEKARALVVPWSLR